MGGLWTHVSVALVQVSGTGLRIETSSTLLGVLLEVLGQLVDEDLATLATAVTELEQERANDD